VRRLCTLPSLLILFVLLSSSTIVAVGAQVTPWVEWTQSYGGSYDDRAYSVVATSDDGYAIAGVTTSFGEGNGDFWLIKTDDLGNIQWNKTYGGNHYDYCYSMIETYDGGFALTGFSWSFGNGLRDFWLVKTDNNGNVEWNQTYGDELAEEAHSIIQTSDNGFVLAGDKYFEEGSDNRDCWIVRTDSMGNVIWNQRYGGGGSDTFNSIIETFDGGFAVAGYVDSSFEGKSTDFWLIKTDSNGNLQWEKIFGGVKIDRANDLIQTSDGGYVLVGYTESFGAGWYDCWLIKTDIQGNCVWNQTFGGLDRDIAYSIVETLDGGFALAGYTKSSVGYGNEDFWLVKTDSLGNLEWERFYGSPDHEIAYSLIEKSVGGYVLAGFIEDWELNDQGYHEKIEQNFWVVKTNTQGIPEFPSWIILPLLLMATLVVTIARNKL
jgi:hypothetical protein